MTEPILMTGATDVAICRTEPRYPSTSPYSPSEPFPEYPFPTAAQLEESNTAYAAVRQSLSLLGLDRENIDSDAWNPLVGVVRPGDTVVLKPNLVREFRETNSGHENCLITHGAVIRAVIDYVYIALRGRGRIIVADAPHNDADFEAIRDIVGLDAIQAFYKQYADLPVDVFDLRPECARKINGVIVGHTALSGDPKGNVAVNLGLESAFAEVNELCHLLYGSEYDTRELHRHQHDDTHEYLIAKTILDADVVISVPKLKTHKKVGLTLNMKNLVGINGNKNWLPHHREGTPSQGGDQFQDDRIKRKFERATVMQFKRLFPLLGPLRPLLARPIKAVGTRLFGDTNAGTVRSGNWYGNDTTWRMVIDLNRILHYADAQGVFHDRPIRRFFSVVDGIIAGEGNGPLDPQAKPTGVVLAGHNPVAVDMACARLAGFCYEQMPILNRVLCEHRWPLATFKHEDVLGHSNDEQFDGPIAEMQGRALALEPHFGWKGHVEISNEGAPSPQSSRGVPEPPEISASGNGSIPYRDSGVGTGVGIRRMLWNGAPRFVKKTVGRLLGAVPPAFLLGRDFRKWLAFAEQTRDWGPEQFTAYQLNQTGHICRLAYERSAFYREWFDRAGFDPRGLKDLDDLNALPTIDRDMVTEHRETMCTVSPKRPGVDRMSTGGTGGRPLEFYINADRSAIEYAYLIASWSRIGYTPTTPTAVFRGRIVAPDRKGLHHEYDPLLRHHYYSTFHMNDVNMRRYLEHVATLGPCFLHVYPSAASALARFIQRFDLASPRNVQGIIAESEIVYAGQRKVVEEVFGCRYFSCYGHSEKLVLAAGCEHSNDYHVWPTYGYVELLDEDGSPVTTPGTRGEIVGTGFINTVMPFIRYRTGDYATYVGDHCDACGRPHMLLRDIQGHRIQEMLVLSDGTQVSWTALNMHDDTFRNVRQFQFRQDQPGRAVLKIAPAEGFSEADGRHILKQLQRKLDGRLSLAIELVENIPLTGRGKAIYVDQRIESPQMAQT